MTLRDPGKGKIIEDWKEEDTLGSGGFGIVKLWKNVTTNKMIAIKQCRLSNLQPGSKQAERWRQEVKIMHRIDHPNVVKAVDIPMCLDVPEDELPLLAMEYCDGGDLRKVLSRPECSSGLKERVIRVILKQISSAINYLHSLRIIHRDLKPENVVITRRDDKVIYKLIDLGYAKELGPNSFCSSFVGTVNYLAPEIFLSDSYTNTVDYWSFGLLAHEIITGFRPFLPDSQPAEWVKQLQKKNHCDICIYLDEDGIVKNARFLSDFNYISSVFKEDMEEWLRVILEYSAEIRGSKSGVNCHELLDQILAKKVLYVFSAEHCQTYHYRYHPDIDTTPHHLQEWIETKFEIPIQNQELLTSRSAVKEFRIEDAFENLEDTEGAIYVVHRDPPENIPVIKEELPILLEKLVTRPRLTVEYRIQKTSWAQAINVTYHMIRGVNKLIHSFKLYLMSLVSQNSDLNKLSRELTSLTDKLIAKADFYEESYHQDMKCFNQCQVLNGFDFEKTISNWKESYSYVTKARKLQQRVAEKISEGQKIQSKIVELQSHKWARTVQDDELDMAAQNLLDNYSMLKKKPRDLRKIPENNVGPAQIIQFIMSKKAKITEEVLGLLRKVSRLRKLVLKYTRFFNDLKHLVGGCEKKLITGQLERQKNIWKTFIPLTVKKSQPNPSPLESLPSYLPPGIMGFNTPADTALNTSFRAEGYNIPNFEALNLMETSVEDLTASLRLEMDSLIDGMSLEQEKTEVHMKNLKKELSEMLEKKN